MKPFIAVIALATVVGVSACDSKQQDAVENRAENKAETIENMANKLEDHADNVGAAVGNQVDALEQKADDVREAGEAAKDRMENSH
ncbi:hypothetical protein OOT33_01425 [Sphingobium sp. DEHP117]|uniref:hypothetical protein n=1 Tax=Sphingobium sp. DEHP117 TaxID=2993436 RepID=UPI0027D4BE11|nr:hypothetical protein [Sphingobium sp. DEHP117]MDQ4419107.1 hypothetical protein [Sphingobium sp. DEHP117]